MLQAIHPNVNLSYSEKHTTGGLTFRGVYQYRDKELGDNVEPHTELVSLGKKPHKKVEAKAE